MAHWRLVPWPVRQKMQAARLAHDPESLARATQAAIAAAVAGVELERIELIAWGQDRSPFWG